MHRPAGALRALLPILALLATPALAGAQHTRLIFGSDHGIWAPARTATGDVNGDGLADVIVGTTVNGHVKVFSGAGGAELASFFAYGSGFSGGVYVAAGDVNGDGRADVITGADASSPHVKVFSGATGAEIRSFLAFPGFLGGISVAAADVNGDRFADILAGIGVGAPGGHVKVFDGKTSALLGSFDAFDPRFSAGLFVAGGQ